MEAARVLFIGRIQVNRSSIATALEKRYQVLIAPSGKLGLELARQNPCQVVVLDAASLRTPGDRICTELRERLGKMPIIHIHPGPKNGAQSVADVVLYQPLTTRRLLNTVDRLLQSQDDETLSFGGFSVNLGRRVLIVDGQETQLTPKQSLLIEMFLRHPGEVLDRKTLMEKVWQTNYMGDTRTLDVHIRWIREAIEKDPGKPQYLRTVRGVGYCLEINNDSGYTDEDLEEEPLAVLT
ncbi:MAG: response regulator transcription factor [Anaerolineae bacterium]|nr:response regulator transcription factor [Anaerolineae bacterium]